VHDSNHATPESCMLLRKSEILHSVNTSNTHLYCTVMGSDSWPTQYSDPVLTNVTLKQISDSYGIKNTKYSFCKMYYQEKFHAVIVISTIMWQSWYQLKILIAIVFIHWSNFPLSLESHLFESTMRIQMLKKHKTNIPMIRTCIFDTFLPTSSKQIYVQTTFVN
jgi:hypothetical protein